MRPLRSKLSSIYGEIKNNTWKRQNQFLGMYTVPNELKDSFKYAGKSVSRITMNKDMIPAFTTAMQLVMERDLENHIKTYDGCFNIRLARGSSRISTHAYGLAIDLNAATNRLGTVGNMNPELVKCFLEAGFVWGGKWKRKDSMHFQFVTEA